MKTKKIYKFLVKLEIKLPTQHIRQKNRINLIFHHVVLEKLHLF